MMENKISPDTERKLVNAIETAATLASNDPARDRNELLAGQLKEAGIDPKFAKVASCAFNKRLTVLTFKKTADEHKADPFELTDSDKVLELLSGETLEKAASLEQPFEISITETGCMEKAASAEVPVKPLYEDTVQYKTLVGHIEGIMEKNAACLERLVDDQDNVQRKADALATELADYFMKSACASFEFDTLVNAYGDRFKNAIGDKLPENTEYTKTASGAILPDTPLYRKASEMIATHETAKDLKEALEYYGSGLSEFCKAAADLGDTIQKAELAIDKKAGAWDLPLDIAGSLTDSAATGLAHGVAAVDTFGRNVVNTAGNALSNAYNLYQAGNAAHMAPSDILDAEFLTKDRYRDRLLGWSDMTADPQFAMYPAEQVFMATQKAMDMDTSLERPDKREVLRSYVAQLLAQNNRMSTADVAALATTLKSLSASTGTAQQQALQAVKGLNDVSAPEMPVLKPVLEGVKDIEPNTDLVGDISAAAKETRERSKEKAADEAARAKEEQAAADKAQAAKEKADAELQADKEKAVKLMRQRQKDMMDAQAKRLAFLRNSPEHITPVINPATKQIEWFSTTYKTNAKGKAVPVSTGHVSQDQVDKILETAELNGLVPPMPGVAMPPTTTP